MPGQKSFARQQVAARRMGAPIASLGNRTLALGAGLDVCILDGGLCRGHGQRLPVASKDDCPSKLPQVDGVELGG